MMKLLHTLIARLMAGMADHNAPLMRELAALSRHHTSEHTRDMRDQPRSDGG
jgi:hypothetical protein